MSSEGTERKRAEAVTESDERFQAIFAQAAVGIAQIGLDGELLLVNNRFCQMLGYPLSELRTKTLQDITHPDYIAESVAGRRKLLAGEISSHTMEKCYIRKDGAVFWGRRNRSLVRDQDNLPKYFIEVMEDITDKVQAERALQESEQRFRATIFQATVGITQCDATGKWLLVNDRFCEIVGYTRAELREKTVFDLTHPDDLQICRVAVKQLLTGEIPSYSEEKRYIRKDGSEVWTRVFVNGVWDADNRLEYFIGVVEDITEMVRAERALRDSEQRFRATFFQAAVGIAQTSAQGQWLLVNGRLCEILGYTPAELRGKTFLDITHPDDRAANIATLRQFLAGEISSWSAEKRYIHKNGATVWAKVYVSLVRDQHHLPQYFITVVEDITERKLIEERLRASEAQLMEAQHLAKVGSWERHIESGTIHWSEEMLRILGLASVAPSNLPTFLSCIHPKDRGKILEIDDKVRSSIAPVEVEYRIIRPDGETRFVRSIVRAIRDDQGVPVRITGATQDITEQVRAAELLRESEWHLRNAARLAHVGHWQWDIPTNRVSGSEEMFRIFWKPQDYTPSYEGFLQDLAPWDRDRVERLIRDPLENKIGHSVEYQIAHPNGDLRTISCTWEVLLDEEGSIVRMFGACQDITNSRRAQEQALARQKLESLGILASGIAHDFNNLLGGILAEAELIEMYSPSHLAPIEELHRIKASAIRGAEIVRELMIYAGQDQANNVEPIDVSRLVTEMLELLKVSISKHAVLTTNLQKDLPAVWGNAPKIRQVVMNLVLNASEAIGEREGVIKVTTEHVSGGKNLVLNAGTDLPEGDYVRLEVSDTGCGITEEARTKIFDPFYTTKFAGRGLGLAVVQGVVHAHGGAISLVSTPGEGTTFEVLLSCAGKASNTQSVASSAGVEESNARTGTVLVVEDEEALRHAVSKALTKRGFSVIKVRDGSAAMEMIRADADDIDLVLLDVTLPGASSREIFEETQRIRPNVKVVVTSAYSKETVDASFAGLRVEHFIRKPFQLSDLVNLLQGVLCS